MRIFWIILGLAAVLAAATLVMSREQPPVLSTVAKGDQSLPQTPPSTPIDDQPVGEPERTPEPTPAKAVEPLTSTADVTSGATDEPPVATNQPPADSATDVPPAFTAAAPPAPMIDSSDPAKALIADLLASIDQREKAAADPPPTGTGDPSGTDAFEIDLNPPPPIRRAPGMAQSDAVKAPSADVGSPDADAADETEVNIVEQDDGSMLVDDRYTIKGSGTPDDPYSVTWDLLVSASKTYQPRQGKDKIPPGVEMLNGAHVKLTGYLTFPLAGQTAKEGLLMLNQWDGCCIGLPPSPYDAIELVLAEPMPLKRGRFVPYGTVEGTLVVEPYLVNKWLVGLYIMRDARLEMGF